MTKDRFAYTEAGTDFLSSVMLSAVEAPRAAFRCRVIPLLHEEITAQGSAARSFDTAFGRLRMTEGRRTAMSVKNG